MAMPNELQSALKQNGGIITTAQANQAGVSNERLRLLVHSGDLERVTTGIYVLPEEFADRCLSSNFGVQNHLFSETALFLLN